MILYCNKKILLVLKQSRETPIDQFHEGYIGWKRKKNEDQGNWQHQINRCCRPSSNFFGCRTDISSRSFPYQFVIWTSNIRTLSVFSKTSHNKGQFVCLIPRITMMLSSKTIEGTRRSRVAFRKWIFLFFVFRQPDIMRVHKRP